MKHLEIHPEADLEVREALSYYRANASEEIVRDFDERISLAILEIGQHPERYPRWRRTYVRKFVLQRFHYLIFYLDYPEHIRVLAVAHTSRRPGYWKKRISG